MNVNVSIALVKQAVPPNPPASDTIRYSILQDGVVLGTVDATLPGTAATFTNVPSGTYTVRAQRLATDSSPLGNAVESSPFTVVDTVSVDVPGSISVTVG